MGSGHQMNICRQSDVHSFFCVILEFIDVNLYTVNNYMQVTGIVAGENFAFFIYRHFVEIL